MKDGVPTIDGTRLKVMHLVIEQRSGLTPCQMQEAHPFLTLAQIHSALAYYYDNRHACRMTGSCNGQPILVVCFSATGLGPSEHRLESDLHRAGIRGDRIRSAISHVDR